MFAITDGDKGKFEGIGAHDDMVMSLALANAATHTMSETFILLDDLGLFEPVKTNKYAKTNGFLGMNFEELNGITDEYDEAAERMKRLAELLEREKEEEVTQVESDLNIKLTGVSDYVMSDYEAVTTLSKNLNINATDARKGYPPSRLNMLLMDKTFQI